MQSTGITQLKQSKHEEITIFNKEAPVKTGADLRLLTNEKIPHRQWAMQDKDMKLFEIAK